MTNDEMAKLHTDILNQTPHGEDPVIYWHRLAMDAIRSADKERQRTQDIRNENDNLKRFQVNENARVQRELKQQTMPPVRELINRVQNGDFSMNIQFSFYPNTERKEEAYSGDE